MNVGTLPLLHKMLAWLAKPECHWTTFVANRVTKITESTEAAIWSHVQSEHNPADLASRGVPLQEPALVAWTHFAATSTRLLAQPGNRPSGD